MLSVQAAAGQVEKLRVWGYRIQRFRVEGFHGFKARVHGWVRLWL